VTILDDVRGLIVDHLKADPALVTLEADLKDALGADSLDAVEIVMAIEEKYKITINDNDTEKLKTVADIVSYLKSKGVQAAA